MTKPIQKKLRFTDLFTILLQSFSILKKNDPLRLAGATAFFTSFALPPIIFILSLLFGLLIGRNTMSQSLITNISEMVGKEGAKPVRQVLRSIHGFSDSWYVIVIGFLFLIFIATTLFLVIKSSLNQIWQISIKDKPGILFYIKNRLKALIIILVTGFLFWANIFVEGLEMVAATYVNSLFTIGNFDFKFLFSNIGSIFIIGAWFILLFRYLADGHPKWLACVGGGLLTSILFAIGKWVLKLLLINTNISKVYGTSGSLVLVLLFVFYCSMILYYGASYIAVYSAKKEWPIIPNHEAYLYRIQKVKKQV